MTVLTLRASRELLENENKASNEREQLLMFINCLFYPSSRNEIQWGRSHILIVRSFTYFLSCQKSLLSFE